MLFEGPMHVGVDSMVTLRTFWKLTGTVLVVEDLPHDSRERKAKINRPLGKRHLSVTKNGDLRQAIWEAMVASSETNIIASSCEYDRHRIEEQTMGPKAGWICLPQNAKPRANKSCTSGHRIPYTFSPLRCPWIQWLVRYVL